MTKAKINEPLAPYLTEEARLATQSLVAAGIDFDLAVAIIEREWPEENIWDIPVCPELEQRKKYEAP